VPSIYFLSREIRWLTRIPLAMGFGALFYLLLLAQNVFNVAESTRTIPLYRAASTASFVFTWITAFLLFNVLAGFDLPFFWNGVGAVLIAFPLVLQFLWTIKMERITAQIITFSFVISLVIGEIAIALSFWPVVSLIWGLFLSTIIYVLLGVVVDYMRDTLTKKLVWEYIGVFVIITAMSFVATSWS
jgi:hypothetical protein